MKIGPYALSVFGGGPNVVRGMVFMLLSTFGFAGMNVSIRNLSAEMHPFEIAFFRSVFGLLFFVPILIRHGRAILRTRRPWLHVLRGSLNAVSMMGFFMALQLAPLAKVSALNFTGPLFATVFAFLILKEVIRARRITALAVGFAGTWVIVRPGIEGLDPGSIYVLVSALASAMGMVAIKILSREDSAVTIALYSTVFSMPFALVAALTVWTPFTMEHLLWLALIGSLGSIGHICVAQSFRDADVTAVLPIEFTKLLWAAILGYLLFAEVPEIWTWLGGVMIFAAVIYIAYRERAVKARTGGAGQGGTDRQAS